MANKSRLDIIEANFIGNKLDAFRDSFTSICEKLCIECSLDALDQIDEGLAGRFTEDFIFQPLSPVTCLDILELKLNSKIMSLPTAKKGPNRISLLGKMTDLARIPGWANARDVETLAMDMARTVYQNHTTKVSNLLVSPAIAIQCMDSMICARQARAGIVSQPGSPPASPPSSPSTAGAATPPSPPGPHDQNQGHWAPPGPPQLPNWNISTYRPAYFTMTEGQHNQGPVFSSGGGYYPQSPTSQQSPFCDQNPPIPPYWSTPANPRAAHNTQEPDPRPKRGNHSKNSFGPPSHHDEPEALAEFSSQARPPPIQTATRSATLSATRPETASTYRAHRHGPAAPDDDYPDPVTRSRTRGVSRDAGVSDEVWEQLQQAIKTQKSQQAAREKKIQEEAERVKREAEEAQRAAAEAEALKIQAQQAKDAEERRLLEEQQAKAAKEARAADEKQKACQRELERLQKEEQDRQREQARVQAKLKRVGKCRAGYEWIMQYDGSYRSAGGAHCMTAAEAGL
ncbi:hypothetical protein BDZ45DRAFT_732566 [Acephala macrosclerotiorum]|nr:hypothetical protein BDZ45DRAFT_732566 [Acephala macrosclerotiorum]